MVLRGYLLNQGRRQSHYIVKLVHFKNTRTHASKTLNTIKRCELLPAQRLQKYEIGSTQTPQLKYLTY